MTQTLRKLVLSGVLLAIAAILPGGTRAAASDCCSNCFQRWEITCYNGCSTLACETNCESHYSACVHGCPAPACQV